MACLLPVDPSTPIASFTVFASLFSRTPRRRSHSHLVDRDRQPTVAAPFATTSPRHPRTGRNWRNAPNPRCCGCGPPLNHAGHKMWRKLHARNCTDVKSFVPSGRQKLLKWPAWCPLVLEIDATGCRGANQQVRGRPRRSTLRASTLANALRPQGAVLPAKNQDQDASHHPLNAPQPR